MFTSTILAAVMTAIAGLAMADDLSCAAHKQGSICEPVNDTPSSPLGVHINLDLIATGFHNLSTAISVKLRNPKTGRISQTEWFQRNSDGIQYTDKLYKILSSHRISFDPDLTPAFGGEGQLPCSVFDDNPGGEAEFEWLFTHYTGDECTFNRTHACYPFLIDVPALHEPKKILLKDLPDICGR
ncbi:MAG: hypothetical protein GOMPHAMPRED_007331 [Gomphillus americanus]|uniref:Uncharacterized protein n=1 Tax=Gomphillus americanus TaxID=1940652 RepID=A0A8H3ET35_9LECA|nr:MAG: hypothetical protein GOMPHAMPRED_007331 [Gomphillus americanus]